MPAWPSVPGTVANTVTRRRPSSTCPSRLSTSCPCHGMDPTTSPTRRSPAGHATSTRQVNRWDGHDHLHPDGIGRGRVGEVGRKRISLLLVNLGDGRQRVTHIFECIRDRVPLGEQIGQQRRDHGVSALGLGLKDERQLVIHQCLQFKATRRCPFAASRLTPVSLRRPPPSDESFSCRDTTTEPIIGRLGSPARGRAEEPRALFVTSLFFRVAKGLRKPLTPGTSEFPYVFSRFASQSQENHDFYPTALLCGVSIAMYDGGLV